ncbi:MAG TPA: tetratricopeptide repeat protein [Bryobacteraceae bacterium]|nr:tetratricopeptide repeat protein [Bryobacteraceae bacterium]
MVSRVLFISLVAGGCLFAQPAQQGGLAPPPPEPNPKLNPERRGDIMMARKMYREAVETYKEAPLDSPIVWNKIGIAYHQMQQLDTAKRHYERAIKLNPKYSEAINNLGTVFYAKKSYRKATNLYKKALKLAPESASIYSNLGTALFARKKYDEAFDAYQQALALDPEVFEHRGSYGVLLQERSVEERARFHYYMAKTYAKAGVNDRALLYLRKAFEEGFPERQKLLEEPEFATMKDLPEFLELLKLEPKVL